MSTIKEIAQITELSVSTVSQVLNGRGDKMRISKETQKRILETAKAIGYQPNVSARRLRRSGSKNIPIIAIFWPSDFSADLLGRFFVGAQDSILEEEYEFEIIIKPYKPSKIQDLKAMCENGMFNAAIIMRISDKDQRYLEEDELNLPIVLFNRPSQKYSSVYVDNYDIGWKTAELFASRRHKTAGMIVPDVVTKSTEIRKKGFLEACAQLGLEVKKHYIQAASATMAGGNMAAHNMLEGEEGFPTAMFFPISIMAVGALPVFRQSGIKIPEDMEIMTYGDYEIEKYSLPSLSTVHFPVEKMVSACIKHIMEVIAGTAVSPTSMVFDTPFIFRETCGGFLQTASVEKLD